MAVWGYLGANKTETMKREIQQNIDMHAGNSNQYRDVPGGGQRVHNDHTVPETPIDWEAHRRFMRGMW